MEMVIMKINNKNKFVVTYRNTKNNKNKLDKIHQQKIYFHQNLFARKIVEVVLYNDTVEQSPPIILGNIVISMGGSNVSYLSYFFPNFPSWAIPMCRIVPIVSSEEAYNIDDCDFSQQWSYWWEIVEDVHARLHVDFKTLSLTKEENGETIYLPLHLNLKMYFVNRNQYHEFSQYKK
jgi:hypothetical protein